MNTSKKQKLLLLLFILTLIFIFVQSLLPGSVSEEESGSVLNFLRPVLCLFLKDEWVTMNFIRKLAHFTEYAVLSLETGFLFANSDSHEKIHRSSAFLTMGLFSAFLDETLQLFTDARSGEVRDIWIDLMGFIAGGLTVLLLRKLLSLRQARR